MGRRYNILVFGLIVLVVVVAGCTSSNVSNNAKEAETYDVIVQHSSFSPNNIEINAGDTVKWKNINSFEGLAYDRHTVTSGVIIKSGGDPDGLVNAPLKKDETFSYTFNEPGEYSMYINQHPQFTGPLKIIVRGG